MPQLIVKRGLMERDEKTLEGTPEPEAAADEASAPEPVPPKPEPRAWKSTRIVLMSLLALAIAFVGGFVVFGDRVGRMKEPPQIEAADAIVVLTGGYQRIDAALELLKMKRGQRLLISGVHPSIKRAELRRVTQADPKLFRCCVDLDHAARDTISNATESAKWIRANGYHRVILVTNNYHIPRSLVEMRRAAIGVTFIPYPVVAADLNDNRWLFSSKALRVLFIEYVKYLAAVTRGFLPPGMTAASAHAWEWAEGRE